MNLQFTDKYIWVCYENIIGCDTIPTWIFIPFVIIILIGFWIGYWLGWKESKNALLQRKAKQ